MLMASIHGGKSSHWKQFALNQWSAWDQDTSEAALRQRRHLEDELTSIVLGPLRYMSAPQTLQFWQRVFEVSANRRLAPDFQADRQSVTFWPSYKTDSGRVEPDAHLLFSSSATTEKQEKSSFEILLEVKWQSPLSGEGQLGRQWKHFPGVDGKKNTLHVLLVIDGARWRQHVLHERRERHASQLSVISWADVQYAASTLRDSGDALGNYAGDIDDYLKKIGFLGIKGFDEFAEPEIFFELSGSNCIFWRGKQYWTWVSDYLFEEQDMSEEKINQNIVNAFRLVDECWSEALVVKNVVSQLLDSRLNSLENASYKPMGKRQERILPLSKGAVKNGLQVWFPMVQAGRGRRKSDSCIFFAICFAKPGISPEHNSPTLHVGF